MATRVLIAEHYKLRTASRLTFNDCRAEYGKNLKAWTGAKIEQKEDYRIVTVVIATCPVAPPKDISEDEDLFVIDIATWPIISQLLS